MRLSEWSLCIGLALALPALSGCRSKLDVKTQAGAALSKGGKTDGGDDGQSTVDPDKVDPITQPTDTVTLDPIEEDGKLTVYGPRLYFQTRDVITLAIKKDVLAGAQSYRLLNVTKRDEGVPPLVLIAEEVPQAYGVKRGFRSNQRFSLTDASETEFVVSFYMGSEGWNNRFYYGKNRLELFVDDEEEPRFATTEMTLLDFDVFGIAVTAFSDNVQVANTSEGHQFQGWINVMAQPTVRAVEVVDGIETVRGVLTHGIFNMVNPY